MKRITLSLLLGASLGAVLSQAQNPHKPVFISPEQLDVASILAMPPADATPELIDLHKLQNSRSAADIEHAKADDVEEDIFIFKDVLGPKFTRASLPATALLSDHVHNDEGVIVGPAKKYFQRPRPFNFDTSIKPVCKTNSDQTDYAYPSGHSTTGYLEALVLTMIVPDKRNAILARADDYAHSRLTCGVHYSSDVTASKFVAYAMIGIIINNTQFQRELAAAKAEVSSLLLRP